MDKIKYVMFTKRTDGPKLSWLEGQLTAAGIKHRRAAKPSFHAPILEVDEGRLDDAWAILDPVDDLEDDDPMFCPYACFDFLTENSRCSACNETLKENT